MKLLRILAVFLLASMGFAQVAPPSPSSGPTSSIVGQLQTATGGVIKGGTLTFTLSQPAIAASTASIVSQTSSCYTSTQGNVVGLPDPVALPVVSTNIVTGTLPSGTYYVKVFYLNASLSVSAPSPETQIILTSNGTLIVNAPAFQPPTATGYGVAIGSTSGGETIQGTVTGWGQYQQSTALVAGAGLQATNNSTCNLWFSDALVPTGTNYSVNLVNANGSQIAGFPQTWCTYGGGNGTINVSQGAPTGNCNVNGVYYPTPIFASPSSPSQSIAGTLSVGGALNVSGTTLLPNLNSIRFAALFPGSNCGAKINAADADLGALPGEIWVNLSCGTAWTTPVSVSSNHVLRFIQCGTYTTTQTVTLTGTNAGILGPPAAMSSSSCVLQAASGAGLAAVVSMPGNITFLNDITIDGNQAAGGTTGATAAAVLIAGAGGRQDIQRVTVQNSSGYGIEVAGGCCIKINRLMAITNVGSGLFGTVGDGFVSDSEFENNGGSGIELSDAPAWRITHSDFGGNGTGGSGGKGIKLYGTAAGGHSSYEIITANQFGNNRNEDIFITGYDTVGGNYAATQSTIVGNAFIGSSARAAVPSVRIVDGYQHQIVGNWFAADATTTYGLKFTETAGGRSLASTVAGNSFNQGFITGYYDDSTITNPNVVAANSEGTSGFSRLGPHPYLLNNSGLYAKDTGGTPVSVLFLGANNATYLWGHPTQQVINFQANPGTTSLGLTGTGVNPDTAGFKHKRVTGCTTGATSGNTCTTTVTWTTAFADANYTPVCTLLGPATLGHLAALSTDVIAAASVKVETVTDTNAAISGTINCIAVHD